MNGAAIAVLACAGALVLAPNAHAQVVPPGVPISGVLERNVRQRWIHEGQHPGFTTFDTVATAYRLSGSRRLSGRGRTNLGARAGNITAILSLDTTFRMVNASYDLPPIQQRSGEDEQQRATFRRMRLTSPAGELPAALFWEVPFVVPPRPLAPGLEWTDTLSFVADPGEGMQQRLSGTWRNRVVRDTLIDGRPLPLVRFEADVRYASREVVTDYTMDDPFVVERDVGGTIVGFAVVDTAIGVRVAGVDTTVWRGSALLRSSDGRSWRSGVRFERERTWEHYDSIGWLARQDSLREARRRTRTGMLVLPATPLEERLRAGDAALADSLFARWTGTTDANERAAIERLLRAWPPQQDRGAWAARIMAARIEAGDSVGRIQAMIDDLAYPRLPPERVDSLLPYLDDPGRLWRLGIVPVEMHYLIADRMLLGATPILEPDSTRWPCAPEVCRRFIELVDEAEEPRLRDAALVGAFAREPARWWDRVVERAGAGSRIARLAAEIADGQMRVASGATVPLPAADSDWRAWQPWIGRQPVGVHRQLDELLFYQARTGQDIVGPLASRWPPPDDSARAVLGAVLDALDALPEPTVEQLAAEFRSGSAARVDLAQRQLASLFARNAQPALEELTAELLAAVLDSTATGGVSPWPWLVAAAPERPAFGSGGAVIDWSDGPLFLRSDGIPPAVTAAVRPPLQPITTAEWDARPRRDGGSILSISPARVWGPFVSIGWSITTFQQRAGDEAPAGYARGGSVILLRMPDGWRIVAQSGWIT